MAGTGETSELVSGCLACQTDPSRRLSSFSSLRSTADDYLKFIHHRSYAIASFLTGCAAALTLWLHEVPPKGC